MKKRKTSKARKKYYSPKLSKEAGEKLKGFFLEKRAESVKDGKMASITVRDYDTLLWHAEDSARKRGSETTTVDDAQEAINAWLENRKS